MVGFVFILLWVIVLLYFCWFEAGVLLLECWVGFVGLLVLFGFYVAALRMIC